MPPVTAFKWAFGHLLAASGLRPGDEVALSPSGDRLAYVGTYYLVFAFWLAALFQLRRLCRLAGHGEPVGNIAPAIWCARSMSRSGSLISASIRRRCTSR